MWEPGFKFTRQWRQEYKINRLYLGAVKRYYPPPDTTQILCQSYLADTVFRIFTLSSPEPLGLIFVTDEWAPRFKTTLPKETMGSGDENGICKETLPDISSGYTHGNWHLGKFQDCFSLKRNDWELKWNRKKIYCKNCCSSKLNCNYSYLKSKQLM